MLSVRVVAQNKAAATAAAPPSAVQWRYKSISGVLEAGAQVRHKISTIKGKITNGFNDGAYVNWKAGEKDTFHRWTELEQVRGKF